MLSWERIKHLRNAPKQQQQNASLLITILTFCTYPKWCGSPDAPLHWLETCWVPQMCHKELKASSKAKSYSLIAPLYTVVKAYPITTALANWTNNFKKNTVWLIATLHGFLHSSTTASGHEHMHCYLAVLQVQHLLLIMRSRDTFNKTPEGKKKKKSRLGKNITPWASLPHSCIAWLFFLSVTGRLGKNSVLLSSQKHSALWTRTTAQLCHFSTTHLV